MWSGQNNPTGVEPQVETGHGRVHALRDHQGRLPDGGVLILFAWFVFYIPNFLGHSDNYIPANPAVTPTHIVPEWYYLPFYAILRAIPNKLLGVHRARRLDRDPRLPAVARHLAGCARRATGRSTASSSGCSSSSASGSAGSARSRRKASTSSPARVLTVYYFVHFLIILPLLGCIETTKPLPNSITERRAQAARAAHARRWRAGAA